MNINLPGDIERFVKDLVISGRFTSEEEAITEAVRLLMSREELRSEVAKGLKQLDDGEWVDGETAFAEAESEIERVETEQKGS